MHLFEFLLTAANICGAALAFLMVFALLWLPVPHAAANRTLALFMGVLGLKFGYDALHLIGLVEGIPLVLFLQMPLVFLYGPLLYVYLRRLTGSGGSDGAVGEPWHFVVFVVMLLLYLPAVGLSRPELLEILHYDERRGSVELSASQQWLRFLSLSVRMPVLALHLAACMLLGLRLLRRHRERVAQLFSFTDRVALQWVTVLWYLVVATAMLVPARLLAGDALAAWIGLGLVVAQVGLVFLLGLFGALQATIFTEPPPPESASAGSGAPERYLASTLTDVQVEEYRVRLESLMRERRPYLDWQLSLAGLAALLDMPPRHLSQVVNGCYDKTFLDYVNTWRVEAARQRLADPGNTESVLTVAMDAGFNSRSAFYSAFRRHVGITPTEYRRQARDVAPTLET